jgi:hypothetical protein
MISPMGEALFQRIYAAGVALVALQRQHAASPEARDLRAAIVDARFAFTRLLMAFDVLRCSSAAPAVSKVNLS